MKKLLTFAAIFFAFSAIAQKKVVENPRLDFFKQTITIYTDSAFKNKKVVSTDFLKFRLLEWKNGGWKAEKRGLSSQPVEVVYIKDDQFVKTPEYREVQEGYAPAFKQKHQVYYQSLIKTYGRKIADGIYFGVPVVGMTARQFYMCMGAPDEINATETAKGKSEQLVYRNGNFGTKYYYLTGGKLSTIQN